MMTRRQWLSKVALATCNTVIPSKVFASPGSTLLDADLAVLEQESGGRLGVAMLNAGTGEIMGHRIEERFPMCSTFKVLAVAAVLKRIDEGKEKLDRHIPITRADILSYAPVTGRNVSKVGMSISELCAAAVTLSDNTAANLLLTTIGGPSELTRFAASLADPMTRLDRNEPSLNEAIPFDVRDTTTPIAMAKNLQALLIETALSPSSRSLLKRWMLECTTGLKKIRAGLPAGLIVCDKTGSGERNTSNDIAVIWRNNATAPITMTVYLTDSKLTTADEQSAIIAKVARRCWETLELA